MGRFLLFQTVGMGGGFKVARLVSSTGEAILSRWTQAGWPTFSARSPASSGCLLDRIGHWPTIHQTSDVCGTTDSSVSCGAEEQVRRR